MTTMCFSFSKILLQSILVKSPIIFVNIKKKKKYKFYTLTHLHILRLTVLRKVVVQYYHCHNNA